MEKLKNIFKNQDQYYVYALIDPRDNSMFYIGKGKGDRVYDHVKKFKRNSSTKSNKKKNERIEDILNSGYDVEEKIIQYFYDEEEALKYEEELIAFYGKENLTNIMSRGCVNKSLEFVKGQTKAILLVKQSAKMLAYIKNPNYDIVTGNITRMDLYNKMIEVFETVINGEHKQACLNALNKEIETKLFNAQRILRIGA
jgi:hypothetical protein